MMQNGAAAVPLLILGLLARSAWCVFVNGTDSAFPQRSELDEDGVHLTTKSSAKYAEAVLKILGKR